MRFQASAQCTCHRSTEILRGVGGQLPTFRDSLLVPSSRVSESKNTE